MQDIREAFGRKLKEIRKNRDYTQEVLAEMIELSPRQLIRIENGKNFPSVETLNKISHALNIDFQNLFDFNLYNDLKYNPSTKDLNNEDIRYILTKLQTFSSDTEKLNYIKLAVDSLDNKKALEELSIIIKGMGLIN
jgi:transcriptional regulator with XRE-family HTH domain